MKKVKLSIIIVSYNTKSLLSDCLDSLKKVQTEVGFEVIVSDNGSVDGSVDLVKSKYKWVKLIANKKNLGFSKGNNVVKKLCKGKYVLFLNSDTVVYKNTLKDTVGYLDKHKDAGAITCKLVLPNGELDKDTRRSFPTPWVAFTHFSGLDKVFPESRTFSRYWYGYISDDKLHEIDVVQGAFFMTRKKILDDVEWFDEDYFFTGEDIDLSWKIKQRGYKLIYFPSVKTTHIKQASRKATPESRVRSVKSTTEAMRIFYRKRLWDRYPLVFNYFMLTMIYALEKIRLIKNIIG